MTSKVTLLFLAFSLLATMARADFDSEFLTCPGGTKTKEETVDPQQNPYPITPSGFTGGFDRLRSCTVKTEQGEITVESIYYHSLLTLNGTNENDAYISFNSANFNLAQKYYDNLKKNCLEENCSELPPLPPPSKDNQPVEILIKNNKILSFDYTSSSTSKNNQIVHVEENSSYGYKMISVNDFCFNENQYLKYEHSGIIFSTKSKGRIPVTGTQTAQGSQNNSSNLMGLFQITCPPTDSTYRVSFTCQTLRSRNLLKGTYEIIPNSNKSTESLYTLKFEMRLNDKVLIPETKLTDKFDPNGQAMAYDYLLKLAPKRLKTERDWALDAAFDCIKHVNWATASGPDSETRVDDFYNAKGIAEQINSLDEYKIKPLPKTRRSSNKK